MLQNGLYGLWGFLKVVFWLAVFLLALGFYFWGDQMKTAMRPWIEKSRGTFVVAYGEKIWNKMKSIQGFREERTERSLELVGPTKIVSEKGGRFSLAVPETWNVEFFDAGPGGQISKIVLTSPAFKENQDGTNFSYDNGARLVIQVFRGELASAKAADGGHGKNLIRRVDSGIVGINAQYHVIRDSLVKVGEVYDLHIPLGGQTYYFRYEFNPEKFNGGEFTFQEILLSLKFNR